MSHELTHDLVNNLMVAQSITPLARAAATVDGTAVDCQTTDGPIHGLFNVGATTGTPTSFAVTCSLVECDTAGGTYTTIANQSSLAAIAAAGGVGFVRGVRTMRYVKTRVVIAFVAGTSPTVNVGSEVMGQKKSY